MKKSTLTKLICLAVLCLMVLPLVMACGKANTVYFDANGGAVEEESRKVKEGEPLGKLPTPKKDGFKFMGWYDEEDTNFEEKISKNDFIMVDTVLVAKWERDEDTMSVEFDPNGGEIADSDAIKYVQKGDNVGKLPTPTREGYIFDCWVLEGDSTVVVRQTTIIKSNTVCVAKWNRIIYCNDGTENHDWSGWQQESQATCETPERTSRVCKICLHTEYNDGAPAIGHDWSNWSEEYMKRSRECYECQKKDYQDFKNVTVDALGSGNYPVIDGDGWGKSTAANLINGKLDEENAGTFAGNGTGAVTVTLDLATPTKVDMIYVKGRGAAAIEVTVTFEDGTEKMIGIGSFGSEPAKFEVEGKVITKVVVYMPTPSNGTDYWEEIALAQDTKAE